MVSMAGKHAVITGAASGIGLACAKAFQASGANVTLLDRNKEQLERVASELSCAHHTIDVGDESAVNETVENVQREAGLIDALVNCAGVLQRTLPPDQLTMKEWDRIVRVHLRGTYLMCASVGSAMAKRGEGAIVNIASISGMRSGPLHAYGPAKAGIINLGECLAGEWGRQGVRVNTVSPGFTQTPALETGIATATLDDETLKQSSALGRLVKADEIAQAALFLSSDMASAITGVTLPVDAGFLVATPWQAFGGVRGK
jgi:NAD(P)-dependent dehydrogenase (short-subunit alcohol dehydrogenase family)